MRTLIYGDIHFHSDVVKALAPVWGKPKSFKEGYEMYDAMARAMLHAEPYQRFIVSLHSLGNLRLTLAKDYIKTCKVKKISAPIIFVIANQAQLEKHAEQLDEEMEIIKLPTDKERLAEIVKLFVTEQKQEA